LTNSSRTRAQVLRNVVEIQALKDREKNPAFVLMQYFGYLRRDPDQAGYDCWLSNINTVNRILRLYHFARIPGAVRGSGHAH
jgi:hypothetical protein